eukprot:GEMP01048892.1.p1 GENE.GEMP01048892.1~~GEMP01048892.1.p1  ORF type:complete len:245 (+),score=49.26 GEMP01048892.1:91-825(+)
MPSMNTMSADAPSGGGSYENTRGGQGVWDTCRVDPDIAHLGPDELPPRIFGYGSLVFRTGFEFINKRPAVVPHFCRRFWQSSIDHRGTHDSPGRTALLLRPTDVQKVDCNLNAPEDVRGYVYDVDPTKWKQWILKELDIREKNGYTRTLGTAIFDDGAKEDVVVYVGSIDLKENPSFAYGSIDETARIIAKAAGPSGTNLEYLKKLHRVREISDSYLDELVARVDAISEESHSAPRVDGISEES